MTSPVDVAVAVLIRGDGAFLLAQRPPRKVYAGYWEFPGGKLEPGESVAQALARELQEELGIEVVRAYRWLTQVFTYSHATVRLHFHRVVAWHGEPHGREGQAVAWVRADALELEPLLPANMPILAALRLPSEYAISNAASAGEAQFLAALDRRLRDGLRLVQLREPSLAREPLAALARKCVVACRPYGARLLVNGDVVLAREVGADGVHLPARQLDALQERPALPLVGASCHSATELERATRLGADFAVLGPVKPTPTHPDARPLGWEGFEAIVRETAIPVFALGGLERSDCEQAWSHGAHGIAMIRGAWTVLETHPARVAT